MYPDLPTTNVADKVRLKLQRVREKGNFHDYKANEAMDSLIVDNTVW